MLPSESTPLLTAAPELRRMLFDMLFPHELGNLSLTCKALHKSVMEDRERHVLKAQARSRQAEMLANGAVRLYTNLCRRAVDLRGIPGVRQMIPEATLYYNERPMVSMMFEGVRYIGRGPHLFISENSQFREIPNIFREAGRLVGARSVRVRRITRYQDLEDPNVVWTYVQIGVNLGDETDGVEYFATIRFVPDGW